MTKICKNCKIEKPADQFNKNNRSPSGLYIYCKACSKERSAAYYVKNKAARDAYRHKYYVEHREEALTYAKEYAVAKKTGSLETFSIGRGKYERTYREGCAPELHDTPEAWKTALSSAQHKLQVARARQFIQDYKAEHVCTDCGGSFHFSAMDFDHLDDDKEFCIAEGVGRGYSVRKLESEISKCELVCSNCHRLRTWLRKEEVVAQCQVA